MTSLVPRKVRSGRAVKIKLVPVVPKLISEGLVKLERVQVICPRCGQQVEAVATDGQVKGYCAVAKQSVAFLIETQRVPIGKDPIAETKPEISAAQKKFWQDPEYRARQSATKKKLWQNPEYRAKHSAAVSAGVKRRWQDPEYRARQIAAHTGKHSTAETKAKLSAARTRLHNRRGVKSND